MFCKNCGTELKNEAAFCHNCGVAVATPKTEPAPSANTAENFEAKVTFGEPEVNPVENTQPLYQMPQYTTPVSEPENDKKGFSIASLVLGICSFLPCCCANFITAILAVVFGIIGIKSSNKNFSVIGIILAAVAFVLYIIVFVLYAFLLDTSAGYSSFFDEYMYY